MKNPLSDIVDIDEREDGLYIKIARLSKESVNIKAIENKLKQARVTNYDIKTINDIISRSRGVFEKAGPLFEYYNDQFDQFIDIKVTPLKAVMHVDSECLSLGLRLTESILIYCLKRYGVCFGIKNDVLRQFIKDALYDKELVVAEGIPPEKGVDGKIVFEIDIDPDCKPKVDKHGKVDFRDIKTFTTIEEGGIIARRIPPKQGNPGKTVTGEEIKSQIGKNVKIPSGKNTEITENDTVLRSLKTGIVYEYQGGIHVGELLDIKNDVDFSVGNIKYTGNVMIRGNVKQGFIVEADGDIEILGEVESATITSRNGFVTIAKGVLGKDDTWIFGKKGVSVGFAQNVNIKTEGILTFEKYLLHCKCICVVLETDKKLSSIIGGRIDIFEHADVQNIGNNKNVETSISLVDRNKAKFLERMEELISFKKKLEKQLEPVQRELKSKTVILKKMGSGVTQRQQMELKKWIDIYNNFNMKIKYIDNKIEELKIEMNKAINYSGYIRIKDTIYGGVKLDLYGIGKKAITTPASNKIFSLKDNAIQSEG